MTNVGSDFNDPSSLSDMSFFAFIFKFDPKCYLLFSLRKTPTLQLYPLEKRRRAVKNPTKGFLDDSWVELQHVWSPKLIEALHNGVKLMMKACTISKDICKCRLLLTR